MNALVKTEYVSCNLCGSSENRFLFNAKDRLHGIGGSFSYVKCVNCGLVYMNPQITPEDIGKFYPVNYAPHQSKAGQRQQNIKKLEKKSKIQYLTQNYFRKLNQNISLLDVGCGNGKFLNEIKTLFGCQVYGIDISAQASELAKKDFDLKVFVGTITQAPFSDNYFDVVTAWQYLEHVHNPLQTLKKICDLLKPNGICVISTPNIDCINAKIFKDRWYNADCPRHLYLYSPATINNLLEKAGLVLTKIIYEPSSKNIINSLQYYFYGDNYDTKYHNKIKNTMIAKWLLSPLAKIFALLKKADNIIVFAKKEIIPA